MPLVIRNSQNANVKLGTTSQLAALTFTDGDIASDTTLNRLQLYDGSTLQNVGVSYSGAAVVTHSTTIGDYSTPSAAVATGEATATASDFEDAYTTNTGWTQTGTAITVDSGIADKLACVSVPTNADHRVSKALGFTLSNSLWIAEFDYQLTSSVVDARAFPFILTAGTDKPRSTQDMLGIRTQQNGGLTMFTIYKDGAGSVTDGTNITIVSGTQYYIRLERTTATNLKLSIFSDSARLTHITGSPTNQTIPSTVDTLTTLQHSSDDAASTEAWSANIDNTKIEDNASVIPSFSANNVWDDSTSTYWKNAAAVNPAVYVDAGSAKNILGLAIYLHADTTETEIKIRVSTDTSFSAGETTRTITVSNLTAGAYNYARFNLKSGRYIQVYGSSGSSKVLAITEIKYLTKTDSQVLQDLGILEISTTDTSLALNGT